MPERIQELQEQTRKHVHLNCWHSNERESMPMWQIYSERGVAIKSTVGDVIEALEKTDYRVHLGEVTYDREEGTGAYQGRTEDGNHSGNLYEPYTTKNEYYDYEQEFRLLTSPLMHPKFEEEVEEGDEIAYEEEHSNSSLYVGVYARDLINEIVLSPRASNWEKETMQDVVERRFGLRDTVQESYMDTEPTFGQFP